MNNKLKIAVLSVVVILTVYIAGCTKKLEEHPYTTFTTAYFQTPTGLQSAVTTLYSGMRYIYGPEPSLAITVMGTDEFTGGDQVLAATGGQYVRSFALYGGSTPISPSDGSLLNIWNSVFSLINLANGVVSIAPTVNIDAQTKSTYIAEARFLRGLCYLTLVSQFGAVPVDLGSGDFAFNTIPYQGFNILINGTKDSVLVKNYNGMIADFAYASQNLPDQRPVNAFRLSKAAAYMMLSRVYIYRGYSKLKQNTDFANAYAAAMEVINNQAKYGVALQQDFGQVNRQGNDYNPEILYAVERLANDPNDNETPVTTNTAGKGNNASIAFAPNYTAVTGAKAPGVAREAIWGRPYRRFAPTRWLWDTCYADKYNDSRYHNSFQMMWYTVQGGVNGNPINYGDTAFVLAETQAQADSFRSLNRPFAIVPPSKFWTLQNNDPQNVYPYLKKFSDSAKGNFNDVVDGRPFKVAKLSELYLLAAEACLQGAGGGTGEAANLINVLRARAAYRPTLTPAQVTARAAALQVTAAQITLDFILDERTRELCGESVRWADLAMRGKLVSRVQAHNPDAGPNIQTFHSLRPIPQSQLDAVTTKNPAYQNPGY
ncbi:MAG: RagB/SusD family nutrient uptake outer membrane protein [Sphingobacteriia bacterium]|nr:RagB/SusD family nutrient uptake outer membrane protein [Sphingobacteriia bacterium]